MIMKLRNRLCRFHVDEDGTAITEFTIFLPIWIMMIIAVTSLMRVGVFSTKVQLQAQKDMWSKVIPITASGINLDHAYWNPNAGYGAASVDYFRVAGIEGNPQALNDGIEGAADLVNVVEGHYTESYTRSLLPPTEPFIDNVDVTSSPEEVLQMDDTERYPHKLLNDTLTDNFDFGGSALSTIISLAALAGFIHHTAAGIQYGSVFGDAEGTVPLFGQWGTLETQFHCDVLVAPRPLTGADADVTPATWAFAIFKGDEEYEEYLQWGNQNWDANGDASEFQPPDVDQQQEDAQNGAEDGAEECEEQQQEAQDAAQEQWEDDGNEGDAPPVDFDFAACADAQAG